MIRRRTQFGMFIESQSWIVGLEALDAPHEPGQIRLSLNTILVAALVLQNPAETEQRSYRRPSSRRFSDRHDQPGHDTAIRLARRSARESLTGLAPPGLWRAR